MKSSVSAKTGNHSRRGFLRQEFTSHCRAMYYVPGASSLRASCGATISRLSTLNSFPRSHHPARAQQRFVHGQFLLGSPSKRLAVSDRCGECDELVCVPLVLWQADRLCTCAIRPSRLREVNDERGLFDRFYESDTVGADDLKRTMSSRVGLQREAGDDCRGSRCPPFGDHAGRMFVELLFDTENALAPSKSIA